MLPDDALSYTHRSGRTARAGKSGKSIAIINPREIVRIREMEQRSRIKFNLELVPDGKAICKKQLFAFVDTLAHTPVKHDDIGEYLPKIYEELESLDKEELIDRLISREFSSMLKDYSRSRDINVDVKEPRSSYQRNSRNEGRGARPDPRGRSGGSRGSRDDSRGSRDDSRGSRDDSRGSYDDSRPEGRSSNKRFGSDRLGPTKRFFISIGRIDKVSEGAIVRLICDKSGIPSKLIGSIEMKREFSFFEVEKSVASKVSSSCNQTTFDGREVQVVDAFNPKDQKNSSGPQGDKKFSDSRGGKKTSGFRANKKASRR